ncbi:MAG TPA: hypothetical protein VE549_11700, partial [Myxococcaceae bacterium]|nr:hypothetical protein [Myxococcaceae bacterium]
MRKIASKIVPVLLLGCGIEPVIESENLAAWSATALERSAQAPSFSVPNSLQLVEATVPELQRALETQLTTSEQLVQMYLRRIEAYDDAGPTLNSFIHLSGSALQDGR